MKAKNKNSRQWVSGFLWSWNRTCSHSLRLLNFSLFCSFAFISFEMTRNENRQQKQTEKHIVRTRIKEKQQNEKYKINFNDFRNHFKLCWLNEHFVCVDFLLLLISFFFLSNIHRHLRSLWPRNSFYFVLCVSLLLVLLCLLIIHLVPSIHTAHFWCRLWQEMFDRNENEAKKQAKRATKKTRWNKSTTTTSLMHTYIVVAIFVPRTSYWWPRMECFFEIFSIRHQLRVGLSNDKCVRLVWLAYCCEKRLLRRQKPEAI